MATRKPAKKKASKAKPKPAPPVTRVSTPTSKLAPGANGSRRLGLGAPNAVAWCDLGLVIATTAGAFLYDLATHDVRQVHVGDVEAVAVAGGEIFLVDANRRQLVVTSFAGA